MFDGFIFVNNGSGMADYVPLTSAPPQIIRVSTWQQFQDFANILKAFIGTGYLSMPFAFHNSGLVLGVVGLTWIAIMTSHCCQLIVKCKHVAVSTVLKSSPQYKELSSKECHEELEKLKEGIEKEMTLGDIGRVAVGKWGVRIVNTALFITQIGFCVTYFIFMGNTIKTMFNVTYKINVHNETVACDETVQVQAMNSQDELLHNSSSMVPPLIGDSSAPTFILLVLIPMPFIILMAFIRDIRKLGPVSGIANIAIVGGFVAFLVYLLNGLHFKLEDVKLTHWETFPVFFGQITCAYEGIGTIIPIESSMAENRPRFPVYLALALVQYSIFLGSFGMLGYLIYASNTPQIITDILPDALFSQFIRIALVIAVLFTYPLQIFPVIEIAEDIIFTRVHAEDNSHLSEVIAGPSKESANIQVHNGYQDRKGDPNLSRYSPDLSVNRMPHSSSEESQVLLPQPVGHGSSTARQYKASTWTRNLLRTILVMISAAIAVLLKNEFAYVIALIGSMGSSLLAYILPSICHLILFRETNTWLTVIKDITLIIIGVVGAVVGVVVTIQNIIMDFQTRR